MTKLHVYILTRIYSCAFCSFCSAFMLFGLKLRLSELITLSSVCLKATWDIAWGDKVLYFYSSTHIWRDIFVFKRNNSCWYSVRAWQRILQQDPGWCSQQPGLHKKTNPDVPQSAQQEAPACLSAVTDWMSFTGFRLTCVYIQSPSALLLPHSHLYLLHPPPARHLPETAPSFLTPSGLVSSKMVLRGEQLLLECIAAGVWV